MPRFAILNHDHPFEHWDLLLENGPACRTWRLLAPLDSMHEPIAAEQLNNHRLVYLEYEGPVSNGRGSVTRWDAGTFQWIRNESDLCEVVLSGERWTGTILLQKQEAANWRLNRSQ